MATGAVDLHRLTSLRALAAVAVFAFHIHLDTDWVVGEGAFRFGYTGVTFFFVLSGFVLTWSWRRGDTFGGFVLRRVARVYPSHLVTALLILLVPLPLYASDFPLPVVLSNLTLTQAWFGPAFVTSLNGVSWTLSCEAFFYVCTPVLLGQVFGRRRAVVVGTLSGWVALCAGARVALSLAGGSADLAYTNPLLRSGDYVLGVLLAFLVLSGWRPRIPQWVGPTLASATYAGLLLVGATTERLALSEVALTPVFGLIVLAASCGDLREQAAPVLGREWVMYAGKLSFAFYLVHEIAIRSLLRVVDVSPGSSVGLAATASSLVLSALAAAALHHGVERPAQRFIVRLGGTRLPVPSLR
ncbi:hypothetical protein LUZ63_020959 [Rhynchospora breviuscula]|uniref:Acyltransferase 3 domain-containing protein n=1 Tax=Rhynchospora breviuscula TaxID=2022672 RepID=A0A9P9Z7K3_9POAL|nr:hypothetical protein LUZ63_020959 [Rhynchospora breviuscula]